jgi:hypothetical protein
MCSLLVVSQQTAVVSSHSVDRLVFVMATRVVHCEVRTRFVYFSCTDSWFRGFISWFANFVRCSGSSKSLNNSANVQLRLSFCPPAVRLLISPCLPTFGLHLLFPSADRRGTKVLNSGGGSILQPLPDNINLFEVSHLSNSGDHKLWARDSRTLSIPPLSQRNSNGRRTVRCLKEIIARVATSLPSFTSFKATVCRQNLP